MSWTGLDDGVGGRMIARSAPHPQPVPPGLDDTPRLPGLRARNVAAAVLLVIGSSQLAGYLLGFPAIRGLGAATAAAPFPKVFSDVRGFETFSARFTLMYEVPGGATVELAVTPELYARLRGPYWRRNVYGAALSYGPRLPREIWEPVFCYGLRRGGPLRTDLGVPEDALRPRVLIETKTRGRDEQWVLEPACDG